MMKLRKRMKFLEIYDDMNISDRRERYEEAEKVFKENTGFNYLNDFRMFEAVLQLERNKDTPQKIGIAV